MDAVSLLRDAISALPSGAHSEGLGAVLRHIESAVRHYERGSINTNEDYFTDAIYRSNQAFEGSLKEAYRILNGGDPSNKKLYEIEQFFEHGKIFRQRVLDQFSRYRQDYRNPSTHEYVLDFDGDEALLAILSVTVFSKLIVDQISERLAFNEAKNNSSRIERISNSARLNSPELAKEVAQMVVIALSRQRRLGLTPSAIEGEIAGHIAASGLAVQLTPERRDRTGFMWDFAVEHDGRTVPVEIMSSKTTVTRISDKADFIRNSARTAGYDSSLIVIYDAEAAAYQIRCYVDVKNTITYIVSPTTIDLKYGSLVK